jgi:hypothetical protein
MTFDRLLPLILHEMPLPRRWQSLRGFYWHYRWWFLFCAAMWLLGGWIVYAVARVV